MTLLRIPRAGLLALALIVMASAQEPPIPVLAGHETEVLAAGPRVRALVPELVLEAIALDPVAPRILAGADDGSVWALTDKGAACLARLGEPVLALRFSPDGARLAILTGDGRVHVLERDVATAPEPHRLPAEEVLRFDWSPDGRRLATVSLFGDVESWSAGDGSSVEASGLARGDDGTAAVLAYVPALPPRVAVGGTHGKIELRDPAGLAEPIQLRGPRADVSALRAAPDGSRLVAGFSDGTVIVWTLGATVSSRTCAGLAAGVTELDVDWSRGRAFAVSSDGRVLGWELASGEAGLDARLARPPRSIAASAAGVLFVAGDDRVQELTWEPADVVRKGDGHVGPIYRASLAPRGDRLASGATDGTVRVWDVETRRPCASLVGHRGTVTTVAFDPEGELVASASTAGEVFLWRWREGRLVSRLDAGVEGLNCLAFSPDGRWLAAGSRDDDVLLWDRRDAGPARRLAGHREDVKDVAFSPAGDLLASAADDGHIRLWRPADGALVRDLDAHPRSVHGVAFSADGLRLASGSLDQSVKLWSLESGAALGEWRGFPRGVNTVAFDPGGSRILATASDGHLRIIDVARGEDAIQTLPARHRLAAVWGVFDSGGHYAFSASTDGTLRLDAIETGSVLASYPGESGAITAIGAGPDDLVLTLSADGAVRAWRDGSAAWHLRVPEVELLQLGQPPGGARFATVADDGRTRLHRIANGAELASWAWAPREIGFLGAGGLVGLAEDGSPEWLDLATGAIAPIAAPPGRASLVRANATGGALALALDDEVVVVDRGTGDVRARLPTHHRVTALAFSPTGGAVAVGDARGEVVRLDLSSGSARPLVTEAHPISCLAFGPAGSDLAIASGVGGVRVVAAKSGGTWHRFAAAGAVGAVAWTDHTGAHLVGGDDRGALLRWPLHAPGDPEVAWSWRDGAWACHRGDSILRATDGRLFGRRGGAGVVIPWLPVRAAARPELEARVERDADGRCRIHVRNTGAAAALGLVARAHRPLPPAVSFQPLSFISRLEPGAWAIIALDVRGPELARSALACDVEDAYGDRTPVRAP